MHDVVEQRYYSLKFTSIIKNGIAVDIPEGLKGAIDSGTSAIVGSSAIVDPLI